VQLLCPSFLPSVSCNPGREDTVEWTRPRPKSPPGPDTEFASRPGAFSVHHLAIPRQHQLATHHDATLDAPTQSWSLEALKLGTALLDTSTCSDLATHRRPLQRSSTNSGGVLLETSTDTDIVFFLSLFSGTCPAPLAHLLSVLATSTRVKVAYTMPGFPGTSTVHN
jgi:hypothetical protein